MISGVVEKCRENHWAGIAKADGIQQLSVVATSVAGEIPATPLRRSGAMGSKERQQACEESLQPAQESRPPHFGL